MKITGNIEGFSLSTKYLSTLALALILGLSACSKQEAPEPQTAASEDVSTVKSESYVFNKTDYLTRNIQDEVFYFVMPDRFHNANAENDNGDPKRPISFGGLDKTSKWAFHGGDIAGLEDKLDYIEGLGITSIWMTPILRNRAIQDNGFGHHGYWVIDFTQIDPHFGSNDDLKSLIAAAHKRDIKIFFDIITNHTADVIKYKECHDEKGKFLAADQKGCDFIGSEALAAGTKYTPFVLDEEKDSKVPAWLNDPKYYNNRGDSVWQGESTVKGDFFGLDDLDTSNPEVISGLSQVFKDLITEFRPDGFRMDTVKHVDIEFWQSFAPAITKHAQSIGLPEFFIFGEVYDDNPAGLSKFTNVGKLPSVLDFSFAFNVTDVVFNNKNVSQLTTLFDNDDYYRDSDSSPNDLIKFLGNHDMGRAGFFIEQSLPNISDDEKVKRSNLAHALMYYSRGVPVVYYGDEQGFTGDGGDVDARENMDPSQVETYNDNTLIGTNSTTATSNFDTQHPLYKSLADLARVRLAHKSLRQGEHINRILDEEKRLYGFSRVLPSDMIDHLIVFNFSNQQQQVSKSVGALEYEKLAGHPNSTATLSGDQLQLTLAPQSYLVLKSNKSIVKSIVQNISMQPMYEENERIFIPFELEFNNPEQFNIAQISVYQVSEDGQKTLISFDTTAPYRAVLVTSQLQDIGKIEVQADNFKGRVKTKVFDLSMF
ncbi:MAG: glycosidase [Alphaproteobacteria bacterium]|jgi:glycosidase